MQSARRTTRDKWLSYSPAKSRDIRTEFANFWTLKAAAQERCKRIKILEGGEPADQELAALLAKAKGLTPASVMCCPVAARRFQIFFSGRALKIVRAHGPDGFAVTLVDPEDAVPFDDIDKICWRALHERLRRRLERALGPHVVAFGMGEVEADYDRRVWQPHYHLTVLGISVVALELLRKKHYKNMGDGIRRMKVKALEDAAWLSYISKLTAFRKVAAVGAGGKTWKQRKRLKVCEFRQFMRYLSRLRPNALVFCLNCSIVKAT